MPDVPAIAIVGRGGSGKTTLIERLIPELRRCGLRVGTIKHAPHEKMAEAVGKDTWRHYQAGAEVVALAGAEHLCISRPGKPFSLQEILGTIDGVDLIVMEGFKAEKVPKIEVWRSNLLEPPACLDDPDLLALVADVPPQGVTVPVLSPEELPALVDLVRKLVKGGRGK